MSEVNLKTERFDICRTVAMKFGRTVVDDTLIVPDIKPDIKKILDVSARSYITDITPGQFKGFTPAYFSSYIYAQSDIYFPGVYKSAVNRSNF